MNYGLGDTYPIEGLPSNWTIQRVGRQVKVLPMWKLLDDGEPIAITEKHCTYEEALRFARKYVEELEK